MLSAREYPNNLPDYISSPLSKGQEIFRRARNKTRESADSIKTELESFWYKYKLMFGRLALAVIAAGSVVSLPACGGCDGNCDNPPVTPVITYNQSSGPPPSPVVPQVEATSTVVITHQGLKDYEDKNKPQTADKAAGVGCSTVTDAQGNIKLDPNCKLPSQDP